MNTIPKNTICLWFEKDAEAAAKFYAATFPDSKVTGVFHAPNDFPSGKKGDVKILSYHVLAADHPVNLFYPQGDYLKSLLLYIE
jgi:predicted 3-demethylubiquinone-9 3-methyltransferase (glyoxalase superfamily)